MAGIGDDAVAAGYPLVPSTGGDDAKVRYGAREINRTRDLIAQLRSQTLNSFVYATIKGSYVGLRLDDPAVVPDRLIVSDGAHEFAVAKETDMAFANAEIAGLQASRAIAVDSIEQAKYAKGTQQAHAHEAGGSRYAVWVSADDGYVFGRATSSKKYKDDIQDWVIDPAEVLKLEPKSFHRKVDPEGVRDWGLIAEEVHEHLPEVVQWHTPEGETTPQIDGLHYDIISVALLSVVKDQQRRIEDLERRLSTLENRTENGGA